MLPELFSFSASPSSNFSEWEHSRLTPPLYPQGILATLCSIRIKSASASHHDRLLSIFSLHTRQQRMTYNGILQRKPWIQDGGYLLFSEFQLFQ